MCSCDCDPCYKFLERFFQLGIQQLEDLKNSGQDLTVNYPHFPAYFGENPGKPGENGDKSGQYLGKPVESRGKHEENERISGKIAGKSGEIVGKPRENDGDPQGVAGKPGGNDGNPELIAGKPGQHGKPEETGENRGENHAKSALVTVIFRLKESGIRIYNGNLLRRDTSADTISLRFTSSFFAVLSSVWKDILIDLGHRGSIHLDAHTWMGDASVNEDWAGHKILRVKLPEMRYDDLQLTMEPSDIFKNVILWVHRQFPRPVIRSSCCKIEYSRIEIACAKVPGGTKNMLMSQYRKFLIANALVTAMGKSGYVVDPHQFHVLPNDAEFSKSIMVRAIGRDKNSVVMHCRMGRTTVRHPSAENTVAEDLSTEHVLNLYSPKVKRMLGNTHGPGDLDLSWILSAANLTLGIINYDLLMKDVASEVQLTVGESEHSGSINSDFLLIMYNYARIVSIMKKFSDYVATEVYPPLPKTDELDFCLLSSPEEKCLVHTLWEWPRVVDRLMDFVNHTLNIPSLLKAGKELAYRFNNFYVLHMVLGTPGAPHNFRKMHARIYLLQSCRSVFEEFLDIIQISLHSTKNE